jgi:hypothetical protein
MSYHRRNIFSLTWMLALKELHIEGCRVREDDTDSVMKTRKDFTVATKWRRETRCCYHWAKCPVDMKFTQKIKYQYSKR